MIILNNWLRAIIGGDSESAWALLADEKASNVSLLQSDMFEYIGKKYARFMEEAQRPSALHISEISR